jgi:hypothetical protein
MPYSGKLEERLSREDYNFALASQPSVSTYPEGFSKHMFALQGANERIKVEMDRSTYDANSSIMESTFLYDPFEVSDNVPVQFTGFSVFNTSSSVV